MAELVVTFLQASKTLLKLDDAQLLLPEIELSNWIMSYIKTMTIAQFIRGEGELT